MNALWNVVEGDGWDSSIFEVIGISEDDEVVMIAAMKYIVVSQGR